MWIFGVFVWRAFKHWFGLMSCAIFTALAIYVTVYPQTPGWVLWANAVLAVTLLFLSTFFVWKDEQKGHQSLIAKNSKPKFKPEIDFVVRDIQNGGAFFVHTHIVNLTESPASIRRVSLNNNTTGEILQACSFAKRSLIRQGVTRLSIVGTEHDFSRKESRITDELIDVLGSLRSEPLAKGDGKSGWLLFLKPYTMQETECPSLSLRIEDAFGETHEGTVLTAPYEYGSFTS